MTDAQANAIEKAFELLSEHFEAFVLVTVIEEQNTEGGTLENSNITYNGGMPAALGLLVRGVHQLLTDPPQSEDDDS